MTKQVNVFPQDPAREGEGASHVPFWVYTREDLYKKQLESLFYSGLWCYVGLETEIPNPGDYRRTVIGERSVIMVRDPDGGINVVENVCAHRGMRFCRERSGKSAKDFFCPYHQWNYSLKGDLQGVPFRRGVKQDGKVNGGMPKEFKLEEHGLTTLKVAVRGGVVFASFDHDVEPLEEFLGPTLPAPHRGHGAHHLRAARPPRRAHPVRGQLHGDPHQARWRVHSVQCRLLPRRECAQARGAQAAVAPGVYNSEMIANSIIYPI